LLCISSAQPKKKKGTLGTLPPPHYVLGGLKICVAKSGNNTTTATRIMMMINTNTMNALAPPPLFPLL